MAPQPHAGLVIRYSYLWRSEYEHGQEEGVKDRPCAVILVTRNDDDDLLVTVLPITHRQPNNATHGVELPAATRRRLGLDDMRQWIVLTEANRFRWPGPDIRFDVGADPTRTEFGYLSQKMYARMRDCFLKLAQEQPPKITRRTE